MGSSQSSLTREAGTSQPARRSAKRRLSASHFLIAVAAALAFVLNLLALQDRDATTLIAIADRPISAGSVFSAESVRMVEVPADFESLEHLTDEARLPDVEGWILRRSIPAGGLIEFSAFGDPGRREGLRSMSVPIEVPHAAGGTVGTGDRVDVITVADETARFVATDLEVISVADSSRGSLGSIGSYHIVVAVEADEALRLAEAIDAGSLEVIRSTGAPGVELGGGGG